MRTLFGGSDRVGAFFRATLLPLLSYAAETAPSIAYSIDDVDRALRWGYAWPLGPFELADAVGALPRRSRGAPLPPARPEFEILRSARERDRVVATNAEASLLDLGEGVLGVALHSKMNAIGEDALEMLRRAVRDGAERFAALVIATEATNFSAGANLKLLLRDAEDKRWARIDATIRRFQDAVVGLRYAEVPVVVAPIGLTLGGGCEIALHADRVQAAAETYMGLVETGVGLIPAAGGTKEMLLRCERVERAFEIIGLGTRSSGAADARRYAYLRPVDQISMNPDRLVFDARRRALQRVADGYIPPRRPIAIEVGGDGVRAKLDLGVHLAWRAGRISDHDAHVGRKLAWVLSGGALPRPAQVSEDHLLDLEREAFLSLCGEPKTIERIRYTLKTGKPLRN